MRRLGVRQWVAWKLQQLAARLYDAECEQEIVIREEVSGAVAARFGILGDEYGSGIVSGQQRFPGYTVELKFGCEVES